MNPLLKDAQTIAMVVNVFKEDSAAIAGGCLRDMDTDRSPRDIDIIIEFEGPQDYAEVRILADRLGYFIQHDTVYEANSFHSEQVVSVIKLIHKDKRAVPIDVIFYKCTVEEAVREFSCNASKVYIDGSNKLATLNIMSS